MFEIRFYKDKSGAEPVKLYLQKLKQQSGKDAQLNFNKIIDYIELLSQRGTSVGKPVIDYLGKGIWELRPLKNRILFVAWNQTEFILLHHFIKKTQKTPKSEIDRAEREYREILDKGGI